MRYLPTPGNGDEMADVMLELATEKTEKKPSRKKRRAKRIQGSAASTRAREEAKRIREREKAVRKDGMELLRREADIQVGHKAAELAEWLTDTALKGDLPNFKALVALAEKKKPVEAVKKKVMTLAEVLMQDLRLNGEWKGPMAEELGEVGEGGVEPENRD